MITELGWDAQREAEWQVNPLSEAGAFPGRVVRVERTVVHVALEDAVCVVPASGCAVGDWVATDGSTWVSVLPRRTELSRHSADRTSEEQVLAANVDAVFVVEPAYPQPHQRRIERMLTLAWASGARPIVLLTKSDLVDHDVVTEVESVTRGVEVISVSSETGHHLDVLAGLISPGDTFILLGPSGAGKSSLVNALAGAPVLATGEVRGDGRGRHTTTRRELITIEGLGSLIDTPGIRSVGMTAQEAGLEATFDDIASLAAQCRFSDCAHATEPGCAVQRAIDEQTLDPRRLDNYHRIEREIAHQARRKNAHSRVDERRETKSRRAAKRVVMEAKGRADGSS